MKRSLILLIAIAFSMSACATKQLDPAKRVDYDGGFFDRPYQEDEELQWFDLGAKLREKPSTREAATTSHQLFWLSEGLFAASIAGIFIWNSDHQPTRTLGNALWATGLVGGVITGYQSRRYMHEATEIHNRELAQSSSPESQPRGSSGWTWTPVIAVTPVSAIGGVGFTF